LKNISTCRLILLFFVFINNLSSSAQANEDQVDKNKVSEYFQNQQYVEAIQYLESKNIASSAGVNLINSLGYAYFMSENYKVAEEQYRHVLSLDSLNFTANRYMALIREYNKNYNDVLFYYKRLLKQQPDNAWLYNLYGDAFSLNKQPDSASLYYSKAYNLQPQNVKIVSAYANNLLDKESYLTADSVLNVFLLKDSVNLPVMRLSIRSSLAQHKMTKAAAFTDRWIRTGEIDPRTSANLALANYSIKNYGACYTLCDTLLKQGIETESLLYYASLAMNKLNDYNKSNDLLRRCLALAISKNTNIYYFSRAENFESLKQYKKAITAYDTAYFLFQDPLALYNIGRIYDKGLNNKKLAENFYKKYVVVAKPKTEDEKKAYAYVKEMLALPKNNSQ